MKKDKQSKMIFALIASLFVLTILIVFFRSPRGSPKVFPAAVSASAIKKDEVLTVRKMSVFQEWGRDPFVTGPAAAVSRGDLALNGICYETGNSCCIINDKIVKTGDEVNGATVMKIQKDSVTVKVGSDIRILKVGRK